MSTPLRLMTANLFGDGANIRSVADLLDRSNPDIVVFQEMTAPAGVLLLDRYRSHHLVPGRTHGGPGIASHLLAECGPIDLPGRAGVYAMLEIEGNRLAIAGVHISNPIEFPWWRSLTHRHAQRKHLLAWANRTAAEAKIVAGDFNSSPLWPFYRRMSERFDDLVEMAPSPSARTWSWRPGWRTLLRIDHVFGENVEPTGSDALPIPGSDHHALIIDFEVNPGA